MIEGKCRVFISKDPSARKISRMGLKDNINGVVIIVKRNKLRIPP